MRMMPLRALAIALLVTLAQAHATEDAQRAPFSPPDEGTIPAGAVGEAIRYGEKLLTHTPEYARAYAGSALNCTSCHLNGGKTPYAAPWVGLWGVFPEYRSRSGSVITLADRINDCFRRSLNGKPLPPESKEMQSILAYIWWLSKGVPTGMDVEGRGFLRIKSEHTPDPVAGKNIYANKCSPCHGIEGQGALEAGGTFRVHRCGGRTRSISVPEWRVSAMRPPSSKRTCR